MLAGSGGDFSCWVKIKDILLEGKVRFETRIARRDPVSHICPLRPASSFAFADPFARLTKGDDESFFLVCFGFGHQKAMI